MNVLLRKLFLAVSLVLLANPSAFAGLKSSAVPGGVVIIALGEAEGQWPEARFNDERIAIVEKEGQWMAVIGIPLSTKPGEKDLIVTYANGNKARHRFSVTGKAYPEQRITIKDKGKVDLSKKSLDRVYREKRIIDGFKATWNETPYVHLDFVAPVDGPLSSKFGLKRFFNDKPRRPHSGLDFAVPEGTPIKAPADAVVIGTGDFFFNGQAVFLEHGRGLITIYGHMSRIDVEQGQKLKQGDVLGAVGKTGRATGAHLHWTVMLNGAVVDPELFISETR